MSGTNRKLEAYATWGKLPAYQLPLFGNEQLRSGYHLGFQGTELAGRCTNALLFKTTIHFSINNKPKVLIMVKKLIPFVMLLLLILGCVTPITAQQPIPVRPTVQPIPVRPTVHPFLFDRPSKKLFQLSLEPES